MIYGNIRIWIGNEYKSWEKTEIKTKILNQLTKILDLGFNNSKKQFIAISSKKVFFTNSTQYNGFTYMDRLDIKLIFAHVMDETYVSFAGTIFRQIMGVPMGGNASPLIADLTLSIMEFNYCRNHTRSNIIAVRYIDDILKKSKWEKMWRRKIDNFLNFVSMQKNRNFLRKLSVPIERGYFMV